MSLRTCLILAATLTVAASAQVVDDSDFNPPRANCCLMTSANGLSTQVKNLADQLQDWNQLGRYYAANEDLKKKPAEPGRVVFMGDSITDFWKLTDSFPGKPYVNRGIGGQTTAQMLVRFYPDVIDLKPAAVTIFAGTNDIARNNGMQTMTMIEDNIRAMADLALKNGIKVILCSLTPISDYTMAPAAGGRGGGPPAAAPAAPTHRIQSVQRPPADILKLNAWIKDYAAKIGAQYVDYFAAVVDDKGMLKDGFSADGLHPNTQGYALMSPVVQAAIDKALKN